MECNGETVPTWLSYGYLLYSYRCMGKVGNWSCLSNRSRNCYPYSVPSQALHCISSTVINTKSSRSQPSRNNLLHMSSWICQSCTYAIVSPPLHKDIHDVLFPRIGFSALWDEYLFQGTNLMNHSIECSYHNTALNK